ncbi:Hsp20/alpha crystallin family protein [Halobacterium yunchengense]|uniref:Hsp20/alpha crystallin family protein n=1 Tax=Halobacterium yunchengense TaxID=3108497 RepID=UPI003009D149
MTWYQPWQAARTYAEQPGSVAGVSTQADAFTGPQGPTTPQYVPTGQQSTGQQSGQAAQAQAESGVRPQQPASVPAVDVIESPTELVVYVDVPGFEKDDLEIHADANRIYLSGDRSEDAALNPDQGERALVAERPVRVERTIPLSVTIDPEQVTADHDNGVCEIVVPKDEHDRRHEIGFQ